MIDFTLQNIHHAGPAEPFGATEFNLMTGFPEDPEDSLVRFNHEHRTGRCNLDLEALPWRAFRIGSGGEPLEMDRAAL